MNDFLNSTSTVPEFVGASNAGKTIGLVIPSVDQQLLDKLHVTKPYKTLGIISDRTGAGPQIMSMDEGVKATNMDTIDVELPRDTEGGGGHGSLIIVGGDDPADARQAVRVALGTLKTHMGDVYNSPAGHVELEFTARASNCVHVGLGGVEGKAFGLTVGCPAGIGVVMADKALKTAGVEPIAFNTPIHGDSFSNEGTLAITGDSGAVRQAVIAAREVGLKLLGELAGSEPKNDYPSYIK